ncbi:MAG: hypothetical protein HGA59_08605 [Chlorobiaceae bacterium]|nr:hypothetical protein [Chlorobiaceae bacterium]
MEEALNSAKIGIVLVSTDFLASDFISEIELPSLLKAAKEKGTIILPLIVKPCRYTNSYLSEFQAVNGPNEVFSDLTEAEQDKRYLKLVDRIVELINK